MLNFKSSSKTLHDDSYFSHIFLNCFDLNIFNLPFKNFLIFYNDYSNVIYTSLTNTFSFFNLEKKHYNWIKALI